MEGDNLKDRFPRIYALARNKNGCINEFGHWEHDLWRRDVELRRMPFGWEEQRWSQFRAIVEEYHLNKEMEDKLLWKRSASGNYTVKAFCKELMHSDGSSREGWKEV